MHVLIQKSSTCPTPLKTQGHTHQIMSQVEDFHSKHNFKTKKPGDGRCSVVRVPFDLTGQEMYSSNRARDIRELSPRFMKNVLLSRDEIIERRVRDISPTMS